MSIPPMSGIELAGPDHPTPAGWSETIRNHDEERCLRHLVGERREAVYCNERDPLLQLPESVHRRITVCSSRRTYLRKRLD